MALAGAPASAATAGRGTGESSVTAARLSVVSGDNTYAVDLGLLDADATLDKARAGVPRNHATGSLSAANVDLGPAGLMSFPREPITVSRDESNTGADRDSQNLTVDFDVPGDVSAPEVGASNPTVATLLTDIEGQANQTVPNGLVARGSARPVDLEAVYNAAGATFTGGSSLASAEAVGGLVRAEDVSISDQEASATTDVVRGAIREVSVGSVNVLDTNSLLGLLGLDPGEIPLANLAAMADELGVPFTGTLGSTPASAYGSWAGARQTLAETRAELTAESGTACAALPGALDTLLGKVGVTCSGTVQQAIDAVDGILQDLLDTVQGAVYTASLVSIDDLTASVQTVATVTEDGRAETSAAANGGIGSVKVGTAGCGSVSADLTTSSLSALQSAWNTVRSRCNAALDEVLGLLGDAYKGLVDVVPVGVGVQTTRIEKGEGEDGDYAVAEARLSLLQVKVTLPVTLPDPPDLGALPSPTTTTTLPPVTTTTVTVPALPIPTTLPTLPIAYVRPAATLGTTVTIDVGALSARAEFTRPGVRITSGGENRTWNGRTGFGGPLPKTGSGDGTGPLAIFAVLAVTAAGLNRMAGNRVRRLTR